MKRVIITLLLLPCFLLCRAQDDLTERGKDILQEYMSGIQSGVDVTPLVIGIKDKYGKANEEQQQEFRKMLATEISAQLSSNQRESARSLINIYQMVANQNDERLPKLYYILGNIYSEQKDTANLKNTISFLKKYPGDSGTLDDYINALNGHLEHIRKYKPVTYNLKGKWITEIPEESKMRGNFNHPKYEVEIVTDGDKLRYKIGGAHIYNFIFWQGFLGLGGSFIFQDENAYAQIEKAYGEDSLYLFWSSEKLSNDNLQDIYTRHQLVGTIGTAVAVKVADGSKNIEDRMAGHMVGGLVEIAGNALFDKLLEPKKRIVILEAWLKKVNNNMFEGVFLWRESKVSNNTNNIKFEQTIDKTTLMRWERESDVIFLQTEQKIPSNLSHYTGKNSYLNHYFYHPPYVYYKLLKKSPNPKLRQVYQNYKDASINNKMNFVYEYNHEQMEKLRKWCMENQ